MTKRNFSKAFGTLLAGNAKTIRMKKIILGALAFTLFAGASEAQTKQKEKHKSDKSEMVGKHYDKALDNLNLDADQKNRVAVINKSFRTQMADLKSQSLSADEMKVRKAALQKQHVEQIHAVLNEQQRIKFQEMQNKNKGKYKYKTKTKPNS